MDCPRITILTPSFNQGAYIEQNIRSAMNQDYANVEHVVIDGGSTDNTVEILKKYPHVTWVSEKDRGQADALNKGLAMATGDIIGWINSDDFYRPNILAEVARQFSDPEVQWVIGNTAYYFDDMEQEVAIGSRRITYGALLDGSTNVSQPGAFFRKCAIESAGGWDANFHMEMDHDLWVRLAKRWPPKMLDREWAVFRYHADQKTSYKRLLINVHERETVLRREGISFLGRKRATAKLRYYFLKGALKAALIGLGVIPAKYSGMSISLRKEFKKK